MTSESFSQIWTELEQQAADCAKTGILTKRRLPESGFNLFLGIQVPENIRMVLIRVKKENGINPLSILPSKGFEVKQVVLPEDKDKSVTIQITLKERCYQDIFSLLSEDIISSSFGMSTEKAMIKKLFLRLRMWQTFLDRHGAEGLSVSAQIGLYGELCFLRDYLLPVVDTGKAASAWTGPARKQQDFQISGIAIEVKAGTGKQHQIIHIASEQQLDEKGLDGLFLCHISLREIHDGGQTLPELIAAIRKELSEDPESLEHFNDLLFIAGYLDEHREKYDDVGYSIRNEQIFHVKENFPRITEKDLMDGVGDVRYSISLSSCTPFIISDEEFQITLGRIKHA